nr:hypothetical protein SFHH103_04795 [Sinorhizobium fredii HH103]
MIRLPTCSTFPAIRCHRLNIKTCVTPPCKSGAKSRVSPQPDSRPRQLSLHQSADNFTVPVKAFAGKFRDNRYIGHYIAYPKSGSQRRLARIFADWLTDQRC